MTVFLVFWTSSGSAFTQSARKYKDKSSLGVSSSYIPICQPCPDCSTTGKISRLSIPLAWEWVRKAILCLC